MYFGVFVGFFFGKPDESERGDGEDGGRDELGVECGRFL